MNYPWCRHHQRYEYVINMGYVRDKIVIDVGSGLPYGAIAMTSSAKLVYAVDPKVGEVLGKIILSMSPRNTVRDNVKLVACNIFDVKKKVDVCIAVEIFEHMEDPALFVAKLSTLCSYAFITTPLARTTEVTPNQEHVAEYSARDFDKIVGRSFEIESKVYQTADLRIEKETMPNGCSFQDGHVVQMAWCKSRGI